MQRGNANQGSSPFDFSPSARRAARQHLDKSEERRAEEESAGQKGRGRKEGEGVGGPGRPAGDEFIVFLLPETTAAQQFCNIVLTSFLDAENSLST